MKKLLLLLTSIVLIFSLYFTYQGWIAARSEEDILIGFISLIVGGIMYLIYQMIRTKPVRDKRKEQIWAINLLTSGRYMFILMLSTILMFSSCREKCPEREVTANLYQKKGAYVAQMAVIIHFRDNVPESVYALEDSDLESIGWITDSLLAVYEVK